MKSLSTYIKEASAPAISPVKDGVFKGLFPVLGYEGWFALLDGRLDVQIYHENEDSALARRGVCEYRTVTELDGSFHIEDGAIYRKSGWVAGKKVPDLTDEEYDVVDSDEFIDAVEKTIACMPQYEFQRHM